MVRNPMQRITSAIRSRTREEWQTYFSESLKELREYVRTNGEKAAVVAFCLGIFIVMFYKLVTVLACLAVIAHQVILIVADSSKGRDS
jgi:hypothetical protein